ncbi:TPA: AlpA family phage regulatory protein, partial [Escherichia coli]|nr:AlpA family phage regulatory protein [Escherichia coli]
YIRPKNLAEELGISMPSLWRWVKAGKMPRPVKLSPRVAAFSTEEINQWLEGKNAN